MSRALSTVLLLLAPVAVLPAAETGAYVVIVNALNDVGGVSKPDLARLFLRQARTWPNGAPVVPVDQSSVSPTRQQFTRQILGMSTGSVRDYWLKQMFSGGSVPPPVRDDDQQVIAFVGSQPGGIGYVSPDAVLPGVVKPLRVEP